MLETRCVEAELPLALGGLCDLLDGAFEDAADGLAEPHRHALAVTLGVEAPGADPPERLVLPRGFIAFVRVLAARGPVLLAIDDVQWLDAPSQRIVAYAATDSLGHRSAFSPPHRGDAGDALGLGHALDNRFTEIRLPPLGAGALHHLVRTRLEVRIPRATMARVHAALGGNPMFRTPEFAHVAATADGPLPLPSSLRGADPRPRRCAPWRAPPAAGSSGRRRATDALASRAGHRRRRGTRPRSLGSRCAHAGLRRRCPLHASTARLRRLRSRVPRPTRRALHAKPRLVEHRLGGTRAPRRAVDLRPGC